MCYRLPLEEYRVIEELKTEGVGWKVRKGWALKHEELSRKLNSELVIGTSMYTGLEAMEEWKDSAFEEHCEKGYKLYHYVSLL